MKHTENNLPEQENTYRTGTSRPVKKKQSLTAVLLMVIILLVGVVTVLGASNLRLLRKLTSSPEETLGVVLYENASPTVTQPTLATQEATPATEGTPSPVADAMVSITCARAGGGQVGTGLVLTENGLIVTAAATVENAETIHVQLPDSRIFAATLEGADSQLGLAVLRIDTRGLPHAALCDTPAQVGDAVYAHDLQPTGATVVEVREYALEDGKSLHFLQLSAPLAGGTALLNDRGQLMGFSLESGLALSGSCLRSAAHRLEEPTATPTLGILGEDVPVFYQLYYGMPAGVYVSGLVENGPGQQLGLQPGDVVVSLDQVPLTGISHCQQLLEKYLPGQTLSLVVYRGGKHYSAQITLGVLEEN